MSGLSDITANLENSRNCLRRIARHDEEPFSKDSLVNIMEKFVKSVNYMDETILIPCRLMDRQVGDATDTVPHLVKNSILTTSHYNHHHHSNHHNHHLKNLNNGCRKDRHQQTIHEFLNAADLFNLYNMLNSLKNDLLWTRNNDVDDDDCNNYDDESNTNTLSAASYGSTSNMSITSASSSSTLSNQEQDVRCKCNCEQQQQQQQQQQLQNINTSSGEQQKLIIGNNIINNNNNSSSSIIRSSAVGNVESIKGHIRRPSTASMTSSNSVSNLSDAESDLSNENDSGIESEGNCGGEKGRKCSNGNLDKATELARECRTHLSGLYRCLEQMTEAANYLTARYQSDIGSV